MKRKPGKGKEGPNDDTTELERSWRKRLVRMKKFRDKNSTTWDRNYKLLFGVVKEGGDVQENEFAYGWGLVKSLETSIYVQNPEMIAEPYDDNAQRQLAHLLTSVSNYDFDQMDVKSIGNLGLIDNFYAGYGAFIEVMDTKKVKKKDGDEEVDAVDEQWYSMKRIVPKDIVFCERGTLLDLSDMPYLALEIYPTVTEVKENPELYTDVPDDIEDFPEASPDNPASDSQTAKKGTPNPTRTDEKDPDFKSIAIWEIWDKLNQKVYYMTDHRNKILNPKGMDWPVKLKFGPRSLYPVTLMAFHPMPKGFYPKPELDLIAGKLDKLNRLDAMIYQDALTKWRKFVAPAEYLSADQIKKIIDMSVENAVIEIDKSEFDSLANLPGNTIPNLRELVVPLEDPSPKKDLLAVRELAKQEITDIIGYGPPERGGIPKARSARETMALKDRQDQRMAKRMDAIGDFYRLAGQKHLKWLQQTMAIDRYTRVFEAAKNLVEYKKYNDGQIKGDFNFIVYAGTSAPRSTESKRQSEIQLFQTLTPWIMKGLIPPEPVITRLAEAMQWKGIDMLLRNYKAAGKQLAQVLMAMQKYSSGDPQAQNVPPQALPNAAAAAVKAMFSPEELGMIAQEAQAGAGGGAGGQENTPREAGDPNPVGAPPQ